eukprot:6065973-Amphidinium_carterae.2
MAVCPNVLEQKNIKTARTYRVELFDLQVGTKGRTYQGTAVRDRIATKNCSQLAASKLRGAASRQREAHQPPSCSACIYTATLRVVSHKLLRMVFACRDSQTVCLIAVLKLKRSCACAA